MNIHINSHEWSITIKTMIWTKSFIDRFIFSSLNLIFLFSFLHWKENSFLRELLQYKEKNCYDIVLDMPYERGMKVFSLCLFSFVLFSIFLSVFFYFFPYWSVFHCLNILWIFLNQRYYMLVFSHTCSINTWCFSVKRNEEESVWYWK